MTNENNGRVIAEKQWRLDPVGRREPEMCVAGNSGAFVRGYFGCGVSLPSGGAYLRRGAVGEHAYGARVANGAVFGG